jgi:two-component system cell cycle sensor histidine kinase PleC
MLKELAGDKRIELTHSCSIDVRVFADQRAFKQIALNLLSNAVKFTSVGQVNATLIEDADGAVLTVEDTGCGISRESIARVFQAFEQADNRYAQAKGGTGLGLTLVRALSELHGGSCSIESEEGKGTRVTVRLPYAAAAVVRPSDAASRAA